MLQSVINVQAKLLRSEFQGMASFRLKKAVQLLRDLADSMQGLLLWVGSILERVEAALGRLPLVSIVAWSSPVPPPSVELDVD